MGTRTVRLDEEAERALAEVREETGLPISEVLKRGLRSLQSEVRRGSARTPYDVYRELEPAPAGSAIGPSTETKRTVRTAIRKKLGR
jgi:8-oxo-dGTP pyrophosphatase MutT (NUDIX family)